MEPLKSVGFFCFAESLLISPGLFSNCQITSNNEAIVIDESGQFDYLLPQLFSVSTFSNSLSLEWDLKHDKSTIENNDLAQLQFAQLHVT